MVYVYCSIQNTYNIHVFFKIALTKFSHGLDDVSCPGSVSLPPPRS